MVSLGINVQYHKNDFEGEEQIREQTSYHMAQIGKLMKVTPDIIALACVYFHLYFARIKFDSHDIHMSDKTTGGSHHVVVVSLACLYMAEKVGEHSPRNGATRIAAFHLSQKTTPPPPDIVIQTASLSVEIKQTEMKVLVAIEFSFEFSSPYQFLVKAFYTIFQDEYIGVLNAMISDHEGILPIAWHFIHDSLRTTLCLQYSSELIAVSALYLAFKLKGITIPSKPTTHYSLSCSLSSSLPSSESSLSSPMSSRPFPSSHEEKKTSSTPWYWEYFGFVERDVLDASDQILACVEKSLR